jgi:hypothetical protein
MQHDKIPNDVQTLAFELFYWFSRFEFALKAADYLKSHTPGRRAEPNWPRFVTDWQEKYCLTSAASALLEANPQEQIVETDGHSLDFQDVSFHIDASDLAKVVKLARTVRNNLFHGGKHGNEGWDNPDRMRQLLPTTIIVLDELAAFSGINGDYRRQY